MISSWNFPARAEPSWGISIFELKPSWQYVLVCTLIRSKSLVHAKNYNYICTHPKRMTGFGQLTRGAFRIYDLLWNPYFSYNWIIFFKKPFLPQEVEKNICEWCCANVMSILKNTYIYSTNSHSLHSRKTLIVTCSSEMWLQGIFWCNLCDVGAKSAPLPPWLEYTGNVFGSSKSEDFVSPSLLAT